MSRGTTMRAPGRLTRRWAVGTCLIVSLAAALTARGDEFSRLNGPALFDAPRRDGAREHKKLGARALQALPESLRGERSPLVIATTDQGDMAKMLLSLGFRKRSGADGKEGLVPVLIVDRFETIGAADRTTRKARGRDFALFHGFQFDLDSGQVVPEGLGGDVRLSASASGELELEALGKNRLYTFEKPWPSSPSSPGRPSIGRAVVPTDFNGRFSLVANGEITGAIDLSVDPEGPITGQFRSDRNGAVYPLTGEVDPVLKRKARFTIKFPLHEEHYEGLLWTTEKNAITGTVEILGHPYGFFAIREGAPLVSDEVQFDRDLPAAVARGTASRTVAIVEGQEERYTFDGAAMSAAELATALRQALHDRPKLGIVLRAPESVAYRRVARAVDVLHKAGVSSIRLRPAAPAESPPAP